LRSRPTQAIACGSSWAASDPLRVPEPLRRESLRRATVAASRHATAALNAVRALARRSHNDDCMPFRTNVWGGGAVVLCGLLMGAGGDDEGGRGCSSLFSDSDAPDMAGTYRIDYDDSLAVEIAIGGAVYTAEIGVQGGVVEIEHEGQPLTFELDCAAEEIVCPSEAFPATVDAEQRNAKFPHQVHILLPAQECSVELREAEASECGKGTDNPDCDDVCDGEMTTVERPVLGSISEDGEAFDVLLGAGVATNGINCGLLGVSIAKADLVTQKGRETWTVEGMDNGEIIAGYSGACLWADDVDMDGDLEAAVLGATLTFTTGFTAERTSK
jgi:hypothetical protein